MTNKREIIGKNSYAVSGNQQFVDRSGQLVRVTKDNPRNPIPLGQAYCFFDCKASKEEIEREIPTIRNLTQTANELELQLREGADTIKGDSQLLEIGREAKDAGLKYVIQASYPNSTNRQTADEVAGILNQAYQSPLYKKGEPFRGGVFYRENGQYISRD